MGSMDPVGPIVGPALFKLMSVASYLKPSGNSRNITSWGPLRTGALDHGFSGRIAIGIATFSEGTKAL